MVPNPTRVLRLSDGRVLGSGGSKAARYGECRPGHDRHRHREPPAVQADDAGQADREDTGETTTKRRQDDDRHPQTTGGTTAADHDEEAARHDTRDDRMTGSTGRAATQAWQPPSRATRPGRLSPGRHPLQTVSHAPQRPITLIVFSARRRRAAGNRSTSGKRSSREEACYWWNGGRANRPRPRAPQRRQPTRPARRARRRAAAAQNRRSLGPEAQGRSRRGWCGSGGGSAVAGDVRP